MSELDLRYALPDETLKDCISFFYQFTANIPYFEDKAFRADLPQFCFVLKGSEGFYMFEDGVKQPMFPAFLLGPTTANSHTGGIGPVCLFGMGILPVGWSRMLPIQAASLTNRVVDGEQLFGAQLQADFAALSAAADFDARVAYANGMMARLLTFKDERLESFVTVVDDWLLSSLSPEIDDLEAASSLSRKQLQRMCNQIYGAPPKSLVRKYRALRVAKQIALGEADPNDFLAEGFTDQSHLIHEVKHYTGHTPLEIRNDPSHLLKLTLQRTSFDGMSDLITGT